MLNEKKKNVVPKLWQEAKVDIGNSDDIKIYYTGKFQDFTARYIIKDFYNSSQRQTQCFLLHQREKSLFWRHLSSACAFNLVSSKTFLFGKRVQIEKSPLNHLPNKPLFLRVCSKSLLKTLWEKEKLHVTSNFSFSHSVFYPSDQISAIFIKFKIVY